ncbi:hypothetical protein LXA43DRAFT_987459 [Ganoderma leucocontextum]|nr:hypothetical protein LXA43DRAFT_987459 [Ganoderma leucocontextum]
MDGGSASLGAEAKRISIPFNRDPVRSDAISISTASYQTHCLLSTSSPFNTTSFLASCLFRSPKQSLNHALLPIGSFHHQPLSKPPSNPLISPIRQSLGLDPETLKNMPSLQPGTADEERARRREATRHQEKTQFPNVLRHTDAPPTTPPATTPQSRSSDARPKRTGSGKDKDTQNRDKATPRPSTRPPGQTAMDQPDSMSLKSTVTPVHWDNPLRTAPHIYDPSPTSRPANHMATKISTTPSAGGRTQEATLRWPADSVRPRPVASGHGTAPVDVKSSSKRPAVPVVGSKSTSTAPSYQAPAAAPSSSSAALLGIQHSATSHPSTALVRTSTESLPTTGLLPSAPCGPQKGTRSKPVAAAATEIVERGKERYEEWHKKRANMKYLNEQELYQKLVEEGRVSGGIHRPPTTKAVEVDKDAKPRKSPVSSVDDLKSTKTAVKGSSTSLLKTGSTESLASKRSVKGSRPSTGGSTGSGQPVQKERSDRADRRGTAKPTADTSQRGAKPSATSAQRASAPTRDHGGVKQARSRHDNGVSSTPFPAAPPEDGTRDDSSLKRPTKASGGPTPAEKRPCVAQKRSTESTVKGSRPSGDSGTRAPLTSQHVVDKVRQAAVPKVDVNPIKADSSTKPRQHSSGKPQDSRSWITESLRTDDSVPDSKHKPHKLSPEGAKKRIRTLSTTATVSDAPFIDDIHEWLSSQDLLSVMPSSTTSGPQDVSSIKTPASREKVLRHGPVASAKNRPLEGEAGPRGPTEKVETAPSTHKAVRAASSQADKISITASDASLQPSRRSSGVSYATVNEPPSKDPASPPATLRAPIARQLDLHSPLLHRCFESIVSDNTYSVVSDNFDPESYPLAFDRPPLPSIPVQVVSAKPEVTPRAPDLPTFTRGCLEPRWPALKAAAVDLKPEIRSVATVKEVRFTENSSEESLLEHAANISRQSARLTMFPNASTVTVSTSSGSGLSLGTTPLSPSRQSPVPRTDIRQNAATPAEAPPSYDDSVVPTRRRTQSDATDKKNRLLLNARLPAPYIDSLFRMREANMASARGRADAEVNVRPRKPSILKRFLGQLGSPFGFKKKKEEDEEDWGAILRNASAQPRAGPSTIRWKVSQPTQK